MLQLAVAGSTRQHAHSREPLSCLRQRRSAAGSTELCRHLGCSSATGTIDSIACRVTTPRLRLGSGLGFGLGTLTVTLTVDRLLRDDAEGR